MGRGIVMIFRMDAKYAEGFAPLPTALVNVYDTNIFVLKENEHVLHAYYIHACMK